MNSGNTVKNHIVNPLSYIRVPFLPSTFSFGISCGVYCDSMDKGEMKIQFIHKDEDDQDKKDQVMLGPIGLDNIPRDTLLPVNLQGFLINSNMKNVIIRKPGTYIARVIHNNNPVYESEIEVVEIK